MITFDLYAISFLFIKKYCFKKLYFEVLYFLLIFRLLENDFCDIFVYVYYINLSIFLLQIIHYFKLYTIGCFMKR